MVPVNNLEVKLFLYWMVVDGWMGLPECNNHYESVGEVEKCWDKFIDLQLCEEIEDAVECNVNC